MAESANINKSLFNLSKVIDSLNDAKKGGSNHVPYRDSKLTRLLQDSLGGGNRATMIINLPPGLSFFHHVNNTLSFASKSRSVVNKPVVNLVAKVKCYFSNSLCTIIILLNLMTPSSQEEKKETMAEKLARFKAEKRRASGSMDPGGMSTPKITGKKRKAVVGAFGKENAPENCNTPSIDERAHQLLKSSSHAAPTPDLMGLNGSKYLLTPGAQLRGAKTEVSLAQDLERDGKFEESLMHYEEAYRHVPTGRLSAKISQLKESLATAVVTEEETIPMVFAVDEAPPAPLTAPSLDVLKSGVRTALEMELLAVLNGGDFEKIGGLKDIGAKRVERIGEYLQEGGSFLSMDDLSGIGMSEKMVDKFIKKNAMHCLGACL